MYDKAKIGQKTTKTGIMPFSYAQHEPDFYSKRKTKLIRDDELSYLHTYMEIKEETGKEASPEKNWR